MATFLKVDDLSQVKALKAPTFWEKEKLLGIGGYGKVYKCRDIDTNQIYAVKMVELDPNEESSKGAEALGNEIEVFKKLRHKNIVQYFGTQNDCVWLSIFIEYMPKGSVKDLIKEHKTLEESTVRKFSGQVVLGLEYLHSKRIIHRDIKAANLLIDNRNNIKLADFGVSKLLNTICSGTASIAGTPCWMAPEVVKNEKYHYKADIWSFGCTIVEMMSGEPPFYEFKTLATIIHKIINCEPTYKLPQSSSSLVKDFLALMFHKTEVYRSSAKDLIHHEFVAEAIENENMRLIDEEPQNRHGEFERQENGNENIKTAAKELRIVMVGKTGNGKSALGNSLLQSELFHSHASSSSITRQCTFETRQLDNGKLMVVVDTPGIFDTKNSDVKTAQEIVRCIGLSAPGPHIFVFVIMIGRFTQEEENTIQQLTDLFGEHVLNHVVVVFNGKDSLDYDKSNINQHISDNPVLRSVVEKCQGRIATINNRAEPRAKATDVKAILDLMDLTVKENGGGYYTGAMFEGAEVAYENKLRLLEEEKHKKERGLERRAQEIEREAERKMLVIEGMKLENNETKEELEKIKAEQDKKEQELKEEREKLKNVDPRQEYRKDVETEDDFLVKISRGIMQFSGGLVDAWQKIASKFEKK